nr:hypothetical protein 10 [Candidatus Aminicenantes bacterium]
MKLKITLTLILICTSLFLFSNDTRIDNIKKNPFNFKEKRIHITGIVIKYGDDIRKGRLSYFIEDLSGSNIKVYYDGSQPEINKNYKICGTVKLDFSGNPYILEIENELLNGDWKQYLIYAGYGVGALIVFILFILLMKKFILIIKRNLRNRPKKKQNKNFLEGNIIKISSVPPETAIQPPGYFEVVEGENIIKELRFYINKQGEDSKITFGRKKVNDFLHIQLDTVTVSDAQASLIWKDSNYTLINESKTEPTIVNGDPMDFQGRIILESPDKIKMGEVVFIFHEE